VRVWYAMTFEMLAFTTPEVLLCQGAEGLYKAEHHFIPKRETTQKHLKALP
jgi:hypothetical protein